MVYIKSGMTCIYVHAYALPCLGLEAMPCLAGPKPVGCALNLPTLLEAKAKAVAKGSENSTAPGSRSSGAGLVGKE